MKSSGSRLVLVPRAARRGFGWGVALCGVVALTQVGRAGSLPLAALVVVLGLLALAFGLDIALTRFAVTPDGVQVRRLLPAQAGKAEISSVEARAVQGLLGGKVRIEIDTAGRTIKLRNLDRYATPEGLIAANTDVAAIREILGGVAPERPSF